MTSNHHGIQKAAIRRTPLKNDESSTQVSDQRSRLSRKRIVSEKELPPLPDEAQDAEPSQTDVGTELSETEAEDFEETSNNASSSSETGYDSYADMVNDHARSSTNISTWDYGIYWTRKAYSQDTRSSHRDSMVTRGDEVKSIQSRIEGYQSGSSSQGVTKDSEKTRRGVQEVVMPEHRNAERVHIPLTSQGLADGMDMDTQISESEYYESSVRTRAMSSSTGLSTWDYGLYWRRRPTSRSTLQNAKSLTHPQSYLDSTVIHEAEDEDNSSPKEYSIRPTPIAVPVPKIVLPKRKLALLPDNYIPVLDEDATIKLPPPYEMTRPPPLLQRIFANLATPGEKERIEGSQRTNRRPRRSDPARYPTPVATGNSMQNVRIKPQSLKRVNIPPDNYIPVVNADQSIRLPPPHKMLPYPNVGDSPPITSWYRRRSQSAILHPQRILPPENYAPLIDEVQEWVIDIPEPHEIMSWEDLKRT